LKSWAYIPSFEHDVFISCAHADNGASERVSAFHRDLVQRLTMRLGARAFHKPHDWIFFDTDLSLEAVATGMRTNAFVAVSPDGRRLVSRSRDGGGVVWMTGQPGVIRRDGRLQSPPMFSADGKRLLAAAQGDTARCGTRIRA
jgi:hypothetical protein